MVRPLFIIFLLTCVFSYAQSLDPLATPDVDKQNQWVESTYQSLSLDQKIGQLFMVMAFSEKDSTHTKELISLVDTYHLGGVIFSKGTPVRQAKLTNTSQISSGRWIVLHAGGIFCAAGTESQLISEGDRGEGYLSFSDPT